MKWLGLAAAVLAAVATPASATLYFDFSYYALGIGDAYGQILTDDAPIDTGGGAMAYVITGITGKRGGPSGDPITGLMPEAFAFDSGGDTSHNLLFVPDLTPDAYGFTYSLSNDLGTYYANLYSTGSGIYEFLSDGQGGGSRKLDSFTVTPGEAPVTPVPEPGTLGLLAGGSALIALGRRRRAA